MRVCRGRRPAACSAATRRSASTPAPSSSTPRRRSPTSRTWLRAPWSPGRSDSIAFLVEETEERMFSDPFFLGMLRSAQETVAEAGLQLVFTVMTRAEDQSRFLAYAAGGHVDGVLLLSLHGQDKLPQRLEDLGVPTVLSGRPLSGRRRLWYVDADNLGGGSLATTHLLASGRRHVATVTGPLDMCAGQDRLAGYRAAVEHEGLPLRRVAGLGRRLHLRRRVRRDPSPAGAAARRRRDLRRARTWPPSASCARCATPDASPVTTSP